MEIDHVRDVHKLFVGTASNLGANEPKKLVAIVFDKAVSYKRKGLFTKFFGRKEKPQRFMRFFQTLTSNEARDFALEVLFWAEVVKQNPDCIKRLGYSHKLIIWAYAKSGVELAVASAIRGVAGACGGLKKAVENGEIKFPPPSLDAGELL